MFDGAVCSDLGEGGVPGGQVGGGAQRAASYSPVFVHPMPHLFIESVY